MIPKRKPAKGKLGTRQDAGPMRCDPYLRWLRGCVCWACKAVGRIEAAHYRGPEVPVEDRGGTGLKPADRWAVPLCPECHRLQHDMGHQAFDRHVGAAMYPVARRYWTYWLGNTEAGRRWRAEHGD